MVSLMSMPITRVVFEAWASTRSGRPAAIAAPPIPRSRASSRRSIQPCLSVIACLLPIGALFSSELGYTKEQRQAGRGRVLSGGLLGSGGPAVEEPDAWRDCAGRG